MERLTKRDGGGNAVVDCDVCELGESRLANCGVIKCRNRLKDRLAYYEDAEEQGRLIVLPCKVGDTVYALWPVPTSAKYVIYIAEVKEIRIAARMNRVLISFILEPVAFRGRRHEFFESDFGKLVFFSRKEAEKALEGEASK